MFLIINNFININSILYLIFFFNAAYHYSSLLYFSVVAENCYKLYTLVSRSARQVKYAEYTIDTISHSRHVIKTTDTI